MLGFRKSMQDVVYLQHITLVRLRQTLRKNLTGAVNGSAYSDGVIASDPPWLRMSVGDPGLPRGQSHDRLHIVARGLRDRNVVDMEAVHHRREYGVGGGETPEQKGSAHAEGRARMRPGGFDAGDVRLYLIAERDRLDWPAEIRWARLPQGDEASMHFAGERTGMSASGLPFRPHCLCGIGLGNILND